MKWWYFLPILSACSQPHQPETIIKGEGIVLANMDSTVHASEDLFRFANGGWLVKTSIPAEAGGWNSFGELTEHNNKVLLDVLQKAVANKEFQEGSDQKKAADFFQVGMDSLLAERSGVKPLQPLFDQIEKLGNRNDIQSFLAQEDLISGDAFFGFNVAPDLKNSFAMSAYLTVGGIGLPERDYYLKTDAKSLSTKEAYRKHITSMLTLAGWDAAHAARATERILILETELARSMLSKEERRDPVKQFNRRAISELGTMVPTVNWQSYFRALGVKEDSVIVSEPLFMKACERVVSMYPIEDIKYYLRWCLLRAAAPFLDHALVKESFAFNKKFLLGTEKMEPRWTRVLATADGFLGEAIGKLYVAATFPPEAKQKALQMVNNIRYAFADRIKAIDWMSDSTKKLALHKLASITVKIGYPDKWKSYAGLTVDQKGSYYGNILSAQRNLVQVFVARLGKPVDRTAWDMSPQTVNAFYNPQFNEIVFPAGILQPPFYNYRADEAVNYGGIGAGIGHEISHGFDDEGSQYDAEGNLRNWWSAEDLRRFKEKGKALADQFSRYEPLPGVHVQGQFTLGENIGDLGGLGAAYDGLHRHFRESNSHPSQVDGMTPEQRFFVSWATIWRAKYRDEALRTSVLTNVHSPAMYRSNGAPSNMVEFYEAFGVKPGNKMYREPSDRVKIW